jgi:hypothetical protein
MNEIAATGSFVQVIDSLGYQQKITAEVLLKPRQSKMGSIRLYL